MRQYVPEHMPLIVEALLDGAAITKREVAVVTLGQVVQSTGHVTLFLRFFMICNLFEDSFYLVVRQCLIWMVWNCGCKICFMRSILLKFIAKWYLDFNSLVIHVKFEHLFFIIFVTLFDWSAQLQSLIFMQITYKGIGCVYVSQIHANSTWGLQMCLGSTEGTWVQVCALVSLMSDCEILCKTLFKTCLWSKILCNLLKTCFHWYWYFFVI